MALLPCQRHLFDLPDEVAYLNCAYMSPLLRRAVEVGAAAIARKGRPWTIGAADFFTDSERARSLFAQLLGASAGDVAIVPAASYGLAVAAANLPLAPAMAFIDTSETVVGVEIAQINARYVEPGQPAEVTFKFMPGTIYTGKVESVLQALATGQVQVSGAAVAPKEIQSAPFVVRVRLDEQDFADRLPAGSTGTAAIFTEHVKLSHIIRRVLLRQIAILNYINPF